MKQAIIRSLVRSRFRLTGREKASRKIARSNEAYTQIARSLDPEKGRRPVRRRAAGGSAANA